MNKFVVVKVDGNSVTDVKLNGDSITVRYCNVSNGFIKSDTFDSGHPFYDLYAPLCGDTSVTAKPAVKRGRRKA